MKRQRFGREYKLEAVKQVRDRGVSSAQVARNLEIDPNVVSRWVREAGGNVRKAFPGHGQQHAKRRGRGTVPRPLPTPIPVESDRLRQPAVLARRQR
jgi:transposase